MKPASTSHQPPPMSLWKGAKPLREENSVTASPQPVRSSTRAGSSSSDQSRESRALSRPAIRWTCSTCVFGRVHAAAQLVLFVDAVVQLSSHGKGIGSTFDTVQKTRRRMKPPPK
ncbi:hypothetical protein GCM10025759_15960 [Lysobacter panacisoli]|uniref:Uncharacterized protein n=1 Tax=Lysobacter panacisoli TaxID=1255263 RepID=A0ABP9LDK1_9GAMM